MNHNLGLFIVPDLMKAPHPLLLAAALALYLPPAAVSQDKKSAPDFRVAAVLAEDGKPFVPGGNLNQMLLEDHRYLFQGSLLGFERSKRVKLIQLDGPAVRLVKGLDRVVNITSPGAIGFGEGVYVAGDADDTPRGEASRGLWWVKGATYERVSGLAASRYSWVMGAGCHVLADGNATPAIYRLEGTKATLVVQAPDVAQGEWKSAFVQKSDIVVVTKGDKESLLSASMHRCEKGMLTPLKFKGGGEVKDLDLQFAVAGGSLLVFTPQERGTFALWRYVSGALHPVELGGKPATRVRPLDVSPAGDYWVVANREAADKPEYAWIVGATSAHAVSVKELGPMPGVWCQCRCAGKVNVISLPDGANAESPGNVYLHDGKFAQQVLDAEGQPLNGIVRGAVQAGKFVVVNLDPGGRLLVLEGPKVVGTLKRPDGKDFNGENLELIRAQRGLYVLETIAGSDSTAQTQNLFWTTLGGK